MRTLFVSLLAISAIALPAVAQTQSPQHGIRTGNLSITHKMRSPPSLPMRQIGESYESFVVSC